MFIYPWATLFPRLKAQPDSEWAQQMAGGGFGTAFFLLSMAIFVAILLVGYVYAWRKGVFRWD